MSTTEADHSNGAPDAKDTSSDMSRVRVSSTRAKDLIENLSSVNSRISQSTKSNFMPHKPRLVAVSKLKPASDLLSLVQHDPPHLHFGENYVQELLEKSQLLPRNVRWHFIGGLQSNKCAQLAREVPNLWAVSSVDSVKKAQLLNKGRGELLDRMSSKSGILGEEQLRVFVQVNTSGEDSKSGLPPASSDLLDLCKCIRDSCPHLYLQGFMTIGAIARSQSSTPETENEDFVRLREARDDIAEKLGEEKSSFELSMGMSEDFEAAIAHGSNEVRVGSTIFGERPPKKEAKVLESTEEEKT
jgi:PLP dependent protein